MNSTAHLRPALVVTAAIVVAFAVGRFVFPYSDPSPTLPLEKGDGVRAAAEVDSLILSWMNTRQAGTFDAAGLVRAKPIEDARVGFFPALVRALARRIDSLYGVPAPVVLAQFALESRFGLSDLGALNFFGHTFPVVRLYGPQPPLSVIALTREFIGGEWKMVRRKFARYRTVEECFNVHGKFLATSPLYKRALSNATHPSVSPLERGVGYAREIGKRYATDPDYALKLITIMKRYQLIGTDRG